MGPIHLNKLAQALYVPSAVLGALPALGVLSLVDHTEVPDSAGREVARAANRVGAGVGRTET